MSDELKQMGAMNDQGAINWLRVLQIVRAILDALQQPQPMQTSYTDEHGICHTECCEKTLKSALQTAHCALEHYQQCCEHCH